MQSFDILIMASWTNSQVAIALRLHDTHVMSLKWEESMIEMHLYTQTHSADHVWFSSEISIAMKCAVKE